MMQLIDKYPEVLCTDGANGTNKDRRVLQFVMATCYDLVRRPVALAILPGETIEAVGFVYKGLQFLVKRKLGPGRLTGTMAMISDQAPGTVRVHRMLSGMKQESAFGGVAFTTLAVRSDLRLITHHYSCFQSVITILASNHSSHTYIHMLGGCPAVVGSAAAAGAVSYSVFLGHCACATV